MRLKDRVAIVVGAGQSPGEGMGNGRATALTFAREGAKVLCVDHNLKSAQETVEMIGALSKLGVKVPGGFATTADAYRRLLAQGGLDERIWFENTSHGDSGSGFNSVSFAE